MGIYMAVYVHRETRSLVRGMCNNICVKLMLIGDRFLQVVCYRRVDWWKIGQQGRRGDKLEHRGLIFLVC
jgi:hypothetical protein